ncbi:MAG TPA: YoaK family protein [Steroidobacteraceae bacterium]|nr:YoaK family protein [Steroidobacteraceae bacterium]
MKRILDLASPDRSIGRDRALGAMLALVAGATNAGGFLAVGQYTSHMTGIVSGIGDALAFGHFPVAAAAVCALLAFLVGAMTTAITVNWARRRHLRSRFAIPLLLEAFLLLAFGLSGWMLQGYTTWIAPATVLMLCYLMGLQNAVITKISKAEIRTTHVTGLITDIGIELGRFIYVNREEHGVPAGVNRERLGVHLLLFSCFLGGSVIGAFGFKAIGFFATIPLAVLLATIALKPVAEDIG